FDSDGRIDIYVANDQTANQLWLNAGNGTFQDAALLSGCALSGMGKAEASMGVMAIDFENDGDTDLFLSHLRNETNTFYLNGAGLFDDTTSQIGLGTPSMPFTGFGLGFADFDHDGVLDLYVANGRVKLDVPTPDPSRPYAEPNQLFRGRVAAAVGVRFEEVLPRGGTKTLLVETSRAAAFGDLDNDGDIDIVVSNIDGRVHVLRNIAGSRGNWIMFRVINARGMNAIGASVRVTANGTKQWRTVQRAYSYCASNDPRVHFGLGSATTVQEILVRWPGGRDEVFNPLSPGKIHTLREGGGRPADRG
ncbi:MAG: CRTAC1 family protein, partial [Planctomycetes bacterium]|nr:CRTAC1 family protein [Planctomycetota bacterium]